MTHIEQMIQDLCPNGVEFKTLGEVTYSIKTGLNPRTNFVLNADGATHYYVTVKEITTGKILFSDKTDRITEDARQRIQERSLLEKDDILFSGIGTIGKVAIVDIPTENWNCSESVYLIKPVKSIVVPKYLMYFLGSVHSKEQYESLSVGSTLKGVRKNVLEAIEIPIPPLEIQKKIVECLDKFSALAAELQAELQMRRKQYEYYRTHLLTPHSDCNSADNTDDCNWEWKTLGEICEILRGKRLTKSELSYEEQYPVYHGGIEPLGKYKTYNREANTVMVINVGASAGTIGFCNEKFWSSDGCFCLSHVDNYMPKFLFYYLQTRENELKSRVRYAGIPTLDSIEVKKLKVPALPLAEQERIVAILDKFEKLITSMEEGIPAEQIRQQKRYEYYRDLLLTFDRKEV